MMRLHKEDIDLKEVIQEAITTVRPMSEEKGLSLTFNIDDDLPILKGDRLRIKQAVLNLLSNAVKFTEKGFVKLSASRRNGEVQVSIQDTGIGIAENDLGTIFEPFRQVDGSAQRKYGGSGIGLTISKRLIELHGGRMWVESKPGIGSTFTFTLPVDEEEKDDGGDSS